MTRLFQGLILLCLWTLADGPGRAATLQQLITDDGEVISGDKRFTNFTYASSGDSPLSASGIMVRPVEEEGLFGVELIGSFFDLPGNGSTSSVISFEVGVTNPKFHILGASLSGNPSVISGTGSAIVTDRFLNDGPPDTLEIHHHVPGDNPALLDWTMFDTGLSHLTVEKHISLHADGETGVAALSSVRQMYKQALVPEPSSIGLLSLTAVGLLGLRRRRKVP